MKTTIAICTSLLGLMVASAAQAQTYTKEAALELAATGTAFKIGDTEFRIAPEAVAKPAAPSTNAEQDVVVGGYVLQVESKAPTSRSRRSVQRLSAASGENLGVAVSTDGFPTVVTRKLDVYFTDIGVLDGLASKTGGKILYSSELGGNAIIQYATVAEAIVAMKQIEGMVGVKAVSPKIIQSEIRVL